MLAFAILGIAVLVLGAIIAGILMLTRPARVVIGPPPADLPVETVSLRSGNGALLKGWYVPGTLGKGAIGLFHGIRSNRAEAVSRMRFLHQAGYGVLVIDFQAHGESEGHRITLGARENADTEAAITWLRERATGPIGAIGASLGGAALLVGDRPPALDALVVELVYPTINEAVANRMHGRLGIIGRWLAPAVIGLGTFIIGVPSRALRPIDGIRKLTMPVLVIGGALDQRTPPPETQALFAAAPEPKRLWMVEGAAHVDLMTVAPAAYEREILGFFGDVFRAWAGKDGTIG